MYKELRTATLHPTYRRIVRRGAAVRGSSCFLVLSLVYLTARPLVWT
jgi:hypothetical protein